MQRFSDFAEARPLDGDKISISSILGKEITVLSYKIDHSKFKDNAKFYTRIQIEFTKLNSMVKKELYLPAQVLSKVNLSSTKNTCRF